MKAGDERAFSPYVRWRRLESDLKFRSGRTLCDVTSRVTRHSEFSDLSDSMEPNLTASRISQRLRETKEILQDVVFNAR